MIPFSFVPLIAQDLLRKIHANEDFFGNLFRILFLSAKHCKIA